MSQVKSKTQMRAWAKTVERARLSKQVNAALFDWAPLHGTVLSYLAMSDEVDLGGVHQLGRCRIALTRTPESGALSTHEYQPDRLERHPLGFDQPDTDAPQITLDEIDVILVPGLAFDRRGYRLGRGKGYYDELLGNLPAGVIRVGVTVDELLVDDVPREAHDQRVAWVATESGVHRVGEELLEATVRFIESAVPLGVAPDIHRFPAGTKTSADAAAAVGAELGEIAKSILFEVDDEPVLVICSGDRRVDEQRLARFCDGEQARIATLDVVKHITGFAAGGTPSVGLSEAIEIVADVGMARYRWVWSAGGTPDTVYPVALDRLIVASRARWAEITDRGKM
ncbi:MAG: 5-formyltetrahydrofolate cyclo-ligase [Acidimicrobiia bacterium]